jgi:hypothetical protein
VLKGQKASIKMNAHNFKYLDWEITVMFTMSNGGKRIETKGSFVIIDTNKMNPEEALQKYKDCLKKTRDYMNNKYDLEKDPQIISYNVKYISFAEAQKIARRAFESGELSMELAKHFQLN